MKKVVIFDHDIGCFDAYALDRFLKFGWQIEQRQAPKKMLKKKV